MPPPPPPAEGTRSTSGPLSLWQLGDACSKHCSGLGTVPVFLPCLQRLSLFWEMQQIYITLYTAICQCRPCVISDYLLNKVMMLPLGTDEKRTSKTRWLRRGPEWIQTNRCVMRTLRVGGGSAGLPTWSLRGVILEEQTWIKSGLALEEP